MTTKTAVVFSGRNGLDFIELRNGVMRIPDVTVRLREAQTVLDSLAKTAEIPSVDLLSVVSSDDEMFFRNIQLKSLCSAIVQVGLYDRYQKNQKRPDFMVGNSNGDSAMMVCAGLQSFRGMIETSQAMSALRSPEKATEKAPEKVVERTSEKVVPLLAAQAMPLLSGLSLTEYNAVESVSSGAGGQEFSVMRANSMELRKLIASLHQERGVDRFISIGPASALRGSDYRMLGSGDLESVDSIELDPMLGWFWRNVRPQAAALAQ